MNRDAILEVKHLSKSFGANAVLKDIDFVVHPGDVTSIIGSSGAGCSRIKSSAACFSTALGVVPCAAHTARNFAAYSFLTLHPKMVIFSLSHFALALFLASVTISVPFFL